MPLHLPPTMAEREAELAALQSAFDEYIASSRELEEELDAELAKMQEKLAESSSANAALSLQLENIAPQLTSLESSLGDCRKQLKEEQRLRRQAEQSQDVAEAKVRELQDEVHAVRAECDAITEELAFKDAELEEAVMKMEIEKEQLREELEDLRADLIAQVQKQQQLQQQQQQSNNGSSIDDNTASMNGHGGHPHDKPSTAIPVDDAYAKKLEDELELVTEQLIETEKRYNMVQDQLNQSHVTIQALQTQRQNNNDNEDAVGAGGIGGAEGADMIRRLQEENADRLLEETNLRRDLEQVKEELALAREEVQAAEDDAQTFDRRMDEVRAQHRSEVMKLQRDLDRYEMDQKASKTEFSLIEKALQETLAQSASESMGLKEEIENLNSALQNAKGDYNALLEELETVSRRFDEACEGAERKGRETATNEVRQEQEKELAQLKDQFYKLEQENKTLQQKLDEAEVNLSSLHSTQDENIGAAQANNEILQKLQTQLTAAKEDLVQKDKELAQIVKELEDRIDKAEKSVQHTEQELITAKTKLAEADARLIVLKREKERAEGTIPKQSSQHKKQQQQDNASQMSGVSGGGGGAGGPADDATTGTDNYSEARDDLSRLSSFDNYPRQPHGHTPGTSSSPSRKRRSRSSSPPSHARLEYKLTEENSKYAKLQREYDELKDQKRMSDGHISRLEEDLRLLRKEMFSASGDKAALPVTQMTRLSTLASTEHGMDVLTEEDVGSSSASGMINNRLQDIIESQDVRLMSEELRALSEKCNAQREYNAQLLSKMLSLQGNIQVYCRIRPMTINEVQRGYKCVTEALSETEVGCFDARTNKWKSFAFDRVWGPDQSQQSIFQDVEPVALSVVDGYNACIFAYGQTGSGKTYTMEGMQSGNQFGISYRTIQKVFHLLNLRKQQQKAAELIVGDTDNPDQPMGESVNFTFSLQLSMLEIYNDGVYDLLGASGNSAEEKKQQALDAGGKASLEIRRDPDGRVEVPNLTRESVNNIDDVMMLLKRGNENRAVSATDLNEHSSRSHMVLLVHVVSGMNGMETNKGMLYLVDLAGSERVRKSNVDGEQLREAGFINKSLSALGNVMEALDRKASHVPYRDSKLTYLLQDSLGGNSRTMMIVTVCPMDVACDESVHALQFATRVRRIQIGAAQRNVTSKNLEETVKTLSDQLKAITRAKERTEGQLQSLKRDNSRIQDRLQNLSQARTQARGDTRTLDVLRKNNTEMATRWQKEKRLREEASDELEKVRKDHRKIQQQLSKKTREHELLSQELQEKEREIIALNREIKQVKEESSAVALRARRQSVLNSRSRKAAQYSAQPTTANTGPTPNTNNNSSIIPKSTISNNIRANTATTTNTPNVNAATNNNKANLVNQVQQLQHNLSDGSNTLLPSENTSSNAAVMSVPAMGGQSSSGAAAVALGGAVVGGTVTETGTGTGVGTGGTIPPGGMVPGSSSGVATGTDTPAGGTGVYAVNSNGTYAVDSSAGMPSSGGIQTMDFTADAVMEELNQMPQGSGGGVAGLVPLMEQQQLPQQQAQQLSPSYAGGVPEIRERVLALLQKYDQSKVNRIDIIMDKFKGKEHLLLQKMEQRYEGTTAANVGAMMSPNNPGPSPTTSVQKRNELAMERHKERMRKLRGEE